MEFKLLTEGKEYKISDEIRGAYEGKMPGGVRDEEIWNGNISMSDTVIFNHGLWGKRAV